MAFIDVAAAVGTAVGADALGAAGATIVGGGILGAGAGALYGGLSGGNIGQDALMGGLLGAGGGALGGPGDPTQYSGIANMFGAGPAATTYETVTPTTPATSTIPANMRAAALYPGMGAESAYTPTAQELNPNAWGSEVGTNAANAASAQNFVPGSAATAGANPASDSLWSGLSKGQKYMIGGAGIVAGANLLGLNKPTTFTTPNQPAPMDTGYYKLNPATFQPNRPPINTNPVQPGIAQPYVYPNYVQNPYQPQQMASGGIASYKDSNYQDLKNQQEELQYFESMLAPKQTATQDPSWVSSPGIYQDIDPNTKYLSPYDAARYRQAQVMATAGMPTSAGIGLNQKIAPYGQITTDPYMVQQAQQAAQQTQGAAQGGIMGYNLGSYAHGGNPRLLDGPGDGMSDDIPATIGGTQPAKLADGEFVVPADVVSHLGNGSTKAGAEKLHHMMDKIRMAKTGKKKQAPQLKTDKFIPT